MRPKTQIDAFQLLGRSVPKLPDVAMTRIEANARLRFTVAQALAQNRVVFHYQPVVCASDPRVPAFHEMLARLRLPTGQILPAGAFLPTIEDCEIGRAIDRRALRTALAALARNPALRLSVNISPLSMGDEEWLAILSAAHRGGSGVCGRLILEITESQTIENSDQTIEFMAYVREMGPAFALDDGDQREREDQQDDKEDVFHKGPCAVGGREVSMGLSRGMCARSQPKTSE